MTTYSVIQKSQLEGAKRLDAEYYQPEYLSLEKTFYRSKTEKIIDLTDFVKKGVFDLSPNNYIEQGVPFVRVQNIKNGFLDEGNLVFISEKINEKEKKTELRPLDIVLSKVGTVGEISIISSHFSKANFSQNVIGLRVKTAKIPKGFLALFLLSKLGQLQIARANMLQVQAKLELKDIRDLLVVRLDEEMERYFHGELLKVEKLFDESKSLYSQAENFLLEELGLKDFEADEDLYSIVNFSDIKSANRMDADYFQTKYEKLLGLLKHAKLLVEITKRVKRRAEIIPQGEYNYIEISDVNAGSGEVTSSPVLGKELPANAKIKITGGELLISKVRPTRGAVTLIPTNWKKDFIASGAFSVFDAPYPIGEYLQVVLRSLVGKLQMERPTTGTSYPTITDEDVENILVPILPKPTQDKIAELVRESHAARKKAKELLEEAKHKVEELIESRTK